MSWFNLSLLSLVFHLPLGSVLCGWVDGWVYLKLEVALYIFAHVDIFSLAFLMTIKLLLGFFLYGWMDGWVYLKLKVALYIFCSC